MTFHFFSFFFLYFAHFVRVIRNSFKKIQKWDNVNFHSKLDFKNSIAFFQLDCFRTNKTLIISYQLKHDFFSKLLLKGHCVKALYDLYQIFNKRLADEIKKDFYFKFKCIFILSVFNLYSIFARLNNIRTVSWILILLVIFYKINYFLNNIF